MAEITQSSDGSQRTNRTRKRSALKIDMTPMVDLAFLLLTFFVLTTSLNKSFIMDLNMPDKNDGSSSTEVPAHRVVTFVLSDSDKIYWYQGLLDPEIKLTNFSRNGLRKIL